MNKYKIIKRKGIRKLLVKGNKGQELSEWELNAMNTNEVTGLLRVDAYKKGFVYNLEYDINGYLTFEEFLQLPMTQETFARLLDNILENLKSVEEKHFKQQLIVFDMDKIYINPSSQRLFFIYVPLQPYESGSTLQEMLLNIIQYSTFDEREDSEYVSEYISILNRGINFSVFDLEQYVRKLIKMINGDYDGDMLECPRCHTMVPADAVLCNCGFKMHGYTGSTNVKKVQVYDMFSDSREKPKVHKDPEPERPKKNYEPPQDEPEKKDPPKKKKGTSLLLFDEGEEFTNAYLIRESTGERIDIDRYPFRLGRESGDYIVDNRYVSDPHMEICRNCGQYFAVDLGSTNKTRIDGEAIPANEERELISGCQLKLANEKFQFFIE